jgi:hypothetical protein
MILSLFSSLSHPMDVNDLDDNVMIFILAHLMNVNDLDDNSMVFILVSSDGCE